MSVCIALQQEELFFPWKIAECPLPTFTFKQFYEEKVGSEFSDRVLKQVFAGQTKESLDLVDYDLVVAEVLSVFGRYVKYNVIFFSQEENIFTGSDAIIMNNEYLPPALVVG